ncbi:chaperonin 10-like protein [Podospora didyma]|uniref:Chaperonin 10-like protein n=1 Tax=Podospora didyma TaxID=330526 RepID=A0AAE0N2V1_9PEZI|nr:chaperonin 10-like protein [Podospora didyma]
MPSNLVGKEYTNLRAVDGKVISATATIPPLGLHDVLIRITHTGVCYTDIEFSKHNLPMALGHEGVGVVEAVGPAVSTLQPGDRAGGGFFKNSCGHCRNCLSRRDIFCYVRTIYGYGGSDSGTIGDYYIGKESYVHKIPEALSSELAAPLQCAGATVYSALVNNIATPRDRVGIVGMGGLGHLAIQFAAKMGHSVVVLSTSKSKEQEALGFGASEFVLLDDDVAEAVKLPVDVLLITGNRYPDWHKILDEKILARNCVIVALAAPSHEPSSSSIPLDKLFFGGFRLHPSLVASRAQHDDMLDFAARNGIRPVTQVYKFEGPETVNAVFRNLEENKVRYRAVLELCGKRERED